MYSNHQTVPNHSNLTILKNFDDYLKNFVRRKIVVARIIHKNTKAFEKMAIYTFITDFQGGT